MNDTVDLRMLACLTQFNEHIMLGINGNCVRCGASIYGNNEPMIVFYKEHATAYDHPKHGGEGKSHTLLTNKAKPIFLTEGYDELPDGTR